MPPLPPQPGTKRTGQPRGSRGPQPGPHLPGVLRGGWAAGPAPQGLPLRGHLLTGQSTPRKITDWVGHPGEGVHVKCTSTCTLVRSGRHRPPRTALSVRKACSHRQAPSPQLCPGTASSPPATPTGRWLASLPRQRGHGPWVSADWLHKPCCLRPSLAHGLLLFSLCVCGNKRANPGRPGHRQTTLATYCKGPTVTSMFPTAGLKAQGSSQRSPPNSSSSNSFPRCF